MKSHFIPDPGYKEIRQFEQKAECKPFTPAVQPVERKDDLAPREFARAPERAMLVFLQVVFTQ